MKSSIITIGTEITDGQILNSNAHWIAKKLESLGLNSTLLIAVPDDHKLMSLAIQTALKETSLIFICGGLGPTSDDFTRDVISDVLNIPLELDQNSWGTIQNKLKERNVTLREGHQQQALLPRGAVVLENSAGVAPGFFIQWQKNKIWALPGPPLEIESIWNQTIGSQLSALAPTVSRTLHTWLTLNIAESEIAHITESFFNNYHFNKEFGYRLQSPYVEVKLWTSTKNHEIEMAIEQFTQLITPYYVAKNTNEIYAQFTNTIELFETVQIYDHYSSGLLQQKLLDLSKNYKLNITKFLIYNDFKQTCLMTPASVPEKQLFMSLIKTEDGTCQLTLKTSQKELNIPITSKNKKNSRFYMNYVLERVLTEANSIA